MRRTGTGDPPFPRICWRVAVDPHPAMLTISTGISGPAIVVPGGFKKTCKNPMTLTGEAAPPELSKTGMVTRELLTRMSDPLALTIGFSCPAKNWNGGLGETAVSILSPRPFIE